MNCYIRLSWYHRLGSSSSSSSSSKTPAGLRKREHEAYTAPARAGSDMTHLRGNGPGEGWFWLDVLFHGVPDGGLRPARSLCSAHYR